jgi:hypothetical protein
MLQHGDLGDAGKGPGLAPRKSSSFQKSATASTVSTVAA